MNKLRKVGFTLAEVLITLGIIGVVAGLTIPTLLANKAKEETVTKLKKTYTILSQIVLYSINENGPVSNWDWGTNWSDTQTFVDTYFLPYMSVAQNCGYGTSIPNICSSTYKKYLDYSTNYLSSSTAIYHVILKDGTYIGFHYNSLPSSATAFYFLVDINGNSSPNIMGRDVFPIMLVRTTGKVIFYGQGQLRDTLLNRPDEYACKKTSLMPGPGTYCGALIQNDSWQIKDDYPW